jgi:HlyD family secretion protein/adhesin transport system membrane fusion protein
MSRDADRSLQAAAPATALVPRMPDARYTLTVQELEECPPPRVARAAALLGLAMIVGFLVWAAGFPVTERALARGEIAPAGEVQPVQHADGGTIAEILVRAGQPVREGQVLLRLDGSAARAEAEGARARETALALAAARLAAAAEGRLAALAAAPDAALAPIRDSQAAMAAAALGLRATQLAVLDTELEGREAAAEGLATLIEPAAQARELTRQEATAMTALFERGLARRAEVHALRQAELRGEADMLRLGADLAAARIAVVEARARRDELAARLRSEALAELARIEAELAETRAMRARAEARLARLDVVAPVAGLLKQVLPRGGGSVVEPGGLVAEIVPLGTLHASVELPADQVGGVRLGQRAQVKVLTYDPARFGSLAGHVEAISPAAFQRPDGSAVFRLRVALEAEHVGPPRLGLIVSPGMTVVAEIATGRRSLLSWLTKPVRNALDLAFAER